MFGREDFPSAHLPIFYPSKLVSIQKNWMMSYGLCILSFFAIIFITKKLDRMGEKKSLTELFVAKIFNDLLSLMPLGLFYKIISSLGVNAIKKLGIYIYKHHKI